MTCVTSFPTSGVYPVTLSSDLFPSTRQKRKRDEGEMIALKYAFKPGSVNSSQETMITSNENGSRVLKADTAVFDLREEQNKSRECVLIYDEELGVFKLHALSTTLHLTLNRSASSSSRTVVSVPQASREKSSSPEQDDSNLVSSNNRERPNQGGKKLPLETPIQFHGPIPTFTKSKSTTTAGSGAKGRGKGGTKKSVPKPVKGDNIPRGKFKSSEIIHDSDEEAGMVDLGHDIATDQVEEEDEFAKMLKENLNSDIDITLQDQLDDEEEEDDEEEDDDDDELGGAVLAVRHQAPGNAFGNGESEWL